MYMGAAENEVIKFHNPPQMTPAIFETYLPYAMVLGVDKIWGKKFQDMLEQMSVDYTSDWYTGSPIGFAGLGNTLNSSLTNSISSGSTRLPVVVHQEAVLALAAAPVVVDSPAAVAVAAVAAVGSFAQKAFRKFQNAFLILLLYPLDICSQSF